MTTRHRVGCSRFARDENARPVGSSAERNDRRVSRARGDQFVGRLGQRHARPRRANQQRRRDMVGRFRARRVGARLSRHRAAQRPPCVGHQRGACRAGASADLPNDRRRQLGPPIHDGTGWRLSRRDRVLDDRHGIAKSDPVNGKLFILATDDGGETWAQVPADAAPPVLSGEAAFAASGTCLLVQGSSNVWIGTGGGARARVFRSTDRGRTWQVADTPLHAGNAASGIFSLAFSDSRHGVAVGGEYSKPKEEFDNVAVTDDGGATWRRARGPLPRGYMSAVAFVPGVSWADSSSPSDSGGTARSDDGVRAGRWWTTVAYNSISFAPSGDGWAARPRGRIANGRQRPRRRSRSSSSRPLAFPPGRLSRHHPDEDHHGRSTNPARRRCIIHRAVVRPRRRELHARAGAGFPAQSPAGSRPAGYDARPAAPAAVARQP